MLIPFLGALPSLWAPSNPIFSSPIIGSVCHTKSRLFMLIIHVQTIGITNSIGEDAKTSNRANGLNNQERFFLMFFIAFTPPHLLTCASHSSLFFWERTKSSKHGIFFGTRIICGTVTKHLIIWPETNWPILDLVALTGSTFVAPFHSFPFNRFQSLNRYGWCGFFDNRRGSMRTDAWWRHITFMRKGFPFCER